MLRYFCVLVLMCAAGVAHAQPIETKIDASAARAVLAALRNPNLSREEALAVARLPGNQGLIRKTRSYDRPASDDIFADALLAAAQGKSSEAEADFKFAEVRDAADRIAPVVEALAGGDGAAIAEVQARIARFTPARVRGSAAGFLIVGGRSGGFAFGEPQFYLNVARFPSPGIAATILTHELYHGVQGLAASLQPDNATAEKCLAAIPEAGSLRQLYGSLRWEGTAAYVGDVLALPVDDAGAKSDRDRFQRGVNLVSRSVTLLGLSTHALTSKSGIAYNDIYALGFYGDEILYYLGYVMTRAIAREGGDAAVADLVDKPGAVMIRRYAALKEYGKNADTPAIDPLTLSWAERLAKCVEQ